VSDRVALAHLPTPVEPMDRLAGALHGGRGPRLLVKRDDATGLALGGNKTRKLERLCSDALAQGCDVLVTGGGPQSNHARQTAAAANRLGLDCALAVSGDPPATPAGNLLLDELLGASLWYSGSSHYYETEAAIATLAVRLRTEGRNPYAIPVGGASVEGVVAYADAVDELDAQGVEADWMFVADGSGGTHAGLLAGLGARATTVVGVDVGTRPDLDEVVPRLARDAAAASGRAEPTGAVVVDHDHVGDGYGAPSDAATEAMELAARTEALVLDPVYTAKAMAALVGDVREGRIPAGDTVLFWHTGGAPALFAPRYAHLFER
jgi:1-aminocyclopropane-1-carboxylate deaminase/D-cysteine desulfhydrase-like pyridoxal-dependent ACC family enzyme